jgi:hypothetical protein
LIAEQKFVEFFDEKVCDNFGKRHEPSHGEVALERSGTVNNADPGTENESVTAVEGGGWLDDDRSRRIRDEIFGKIPYLAHQLSVF